MKPLGSHGRISVHEKKILALPIQVTLFEKTQDVNRKMLQSSRRMKLLLKQDDMHFMHCLREVRMFM